MLMLEPKAKRAVVVMTNSEWANPAQVAAAVLDAVRAMTPVSREASAERGSRRARLTPRG